MEMSACVCVCVCECTVSECVCVCGLLYANALAEGESVWGLVISCRPAVASGHFVLNARRRSLDT